MTTTTLTKKESLYSRSTAKHIIKNTQNIYIWRIYRADGTNEQLNAHKKKIIPVTIAWSRSYGSSVICSSGLNISARNALTSLSKTASGATVESIQFALIEITT
jgi:hypothetical protein